MISEPESKSKSLTYLTRDDLSDPPIDERETIVSRERAFFQRVS